ncbi:MAG: glycosyltransferase family 39 protein [Candidatus Omnitrophota bacterium]|nr:MAG: glycosyltransferase family 39 protein [Candidatus Omnitrophota bacterium]
MKKLLLILCILSFMAGFLTLNKYWAPFDEGVAIVGSERVLRGEVPYKDFFVANYPPGQFYVLSFLYRMFGVSLEIGRFYTVLLHVLIAMCIFLIARKLTERTDIAVISWIISMTCLGPRLGIVSTAIWPGLGFAIFSIYLFMKYIEQDRMRYLFYSGMAVGAGVLFRHDIGLSAFLSIFATLLIYKKSVRRICNFAIYSLAMPLAVLFYLFLKSASKGLFESLVLFPFIHIKTAALTFPKPCFDLSMIFHQSLYFIKVNQYYIPLLTYAFIVIFLISVLIKEKGFGKKHIMLLLLVLFGLLTFTHVKVRTDPAHLLTIIHPSILLFGFILNKAVSRDAPAKTKYVFGLYAILLSFLFFLLAVKNIDKSFKNVFRKPYKGSVMLTGFDRGSVYIPREEKQDIVDVVSFIKANTGPNERIYVGNIAHWVPAFGGSTIIYFLTERSPSTKYYELHPGLVTQEKVQREIVKSLSKENVNFIILQDIDIPNEGYVHRTMILDNHIKENFKPVKKFGKYNIYVRK